MKNKSVNFAFFSELLALANPPDETGSIVDWSPFPEGDKLDLIIERHNIWRYDKQRNSLTPEFFKRLSEGIRLSDLSMARWDELSKDVLEKTTILVVDLKAFAETDPRIYELNTMMSGAAYSWKKPGDISFVTQLSPDQQAKPLAGLFPSIPVGWSDPRVLTSQESFEEFLRAHAEKYLAIAINVDLNRLSGGGFMQLSGLGRQLDERTNAIFRDQLPEIVRDLRNEALRDALEPDQIESRLQTRIASEVALASVTAKVHDLTSLPTILDAVREAIANIYREPLDLVLEEQPIELVGISLNRPLDILSPRQRQLASTLGLESPDSVTIQIDQPEVRENIARLSGNIETINFTAMLPLSLRGGDVFNPELRR